MMLNSGLMAVGAIVVLAALAAVHSVLTVSPKRGDSADRNASQRAELRAAIAEFEARVSRIVNGK